MNQEMLGEKRIGRRALIRLGLFGGTAALFLSGCQQPNPAYRGEIPSAPTSLPALTAIPDEAPTRAPAAAPTTSPDQVTSLPMTKESREYYLNHAKTIDYILRDSLLPNIFQGISSPELASLEKTLVTQPSAYQSQQQLDYDLYHAVRDVISIGKSSAYQYIYDLTRVGFTFDDPLLIKKYASPWFDIEMLVEYKAGEAKNRSHGALTEEVVKYTLELYPFSKLRDPDKINELSSIASKIFILPYGDNWITSVSGVLVSTEQMYSVADGEYLNCKVDNNGVLSYEISYPKRKRYPSA